MYVMQVNVYEKAVEKFQGNWLIQLLIIEFLIVICQFGV